MLRISTLLTIILIVSGVTDAVGPMKGPTQSPGACPKGWMQYEDQCYTEPAFGSENFKTWDDARTSCQSLGGDLASVHSQSAQSFLTAAMEFELADVWIGLTNRQSNPDFRWADGNVLDYLNWGKLQPDGYPGSIGDNPDACVVLMSTRTEAGKWNDQSCDRLLPFYCQKPLDPSLTPPSGGMISLCNPGYESYFQACFRYVSEPATFDEAEAECVKERTHLASIADAYEQAYVETVMYERNVDSVWIGLRKQDDESNYVWTDEWPVYYTTWGPGEPSGGVGEGCVESTTYGHWDDTSCNKTQPYVCKYTDTMKPTPGPTSEGYCPSGWVEYGSSCYIFYDWIAEEVTWADAQLACVQEKGHLLTAHNLDENQFILMQWNARSVSAGQDFFAAGEPPENNLWLGVVRNSDGGFEYFDGEPLNFVYWATGEPHDGDGYDCVVMNADVHGHWGTKQCDHLEKYGCKKPTLPPTTGPTRVTTMTERISTRPQQTTPDDEPNNNGNDGLSVGAIVGIVLASVAGSLLAVALGAWYYHTRRSTTPSRHKFDNEIDIPRRIDPTDSTA